MRGKKKLAIVEVKKIFVSLLVALLSVFRGAKNRAPYWLFVRFLRVYYPASLKDAF